MVRYPKLQQHDRSFRRQRAQTIPLLLSSLLSIIITIQYCTNVSSAYVEEQRVEEYYKRHYKYPPTDVIPNTTGWTELMHRRLRQIEKLTDINDRYEGFFQTIHSATKVQNFTEYGFGLAKCPDDLLQELQKAIYDGLETARYEGEDAVIEGPEQPWFIDGAELINRVMLELQGYAEEWVGLDLTPQNAYGFRVYRNQSQLHMHVDQLLTHVISFILHIDSSDDAEPWPIYIEDFHGRTHEVVLTPGDMLFYESSKCFHGRPKPFNGSWYTSVFVHYYPKEGWIDYPHEDESHYAVPPFWNQIPEPSTSTTDKVEDDVPILEMVETALREPYCPNKWCGTIDAVSWGGPAEVNTLITPALERIPFYPKRYTINIEDINAYNTKIVEEHEASDEF